jgi:signal transduction histidine kinase
MPLHPEFPVDDRNHEFAERRKAISEAFHSFHQPLTSLHCGLELALYKPRTEGEYRKRIEDALANAAAILRLNKALRELVDAADPGERFGTIDFPSFAAQVRDQVSVVAESAGVVVRWSGECEGRLAADPMKLLQMLGNVLSCAIAEVTAGAEVHVDCKIEEGSFLLSITASGPRAPAREPSDIEQKLCEIRMDAARCYCRALEGSLTSSEKALEMKLPIQS